MQNLCELWFKNTIILSEHTAVHVISQNFTADTENNSVPA